MTNWLIQSSVLCYDMVLWGCRVLIQSTLLIGIALLVVRALGSKRVVLQTSVLRSGLLAVLVCPVLSILGIPSLIHLHVPLETPVYFHNVSHSRLLLPKPGPAPLSTANPALTELENTSPPSIQTQRMQQGSTSTFETYLHKSSVSIHLTMFYSTLSVAWVLGTLVLLIRLGGAHLQIKRIRKHAMPAHETIQSTCRHIAENMGIRPPAALISRHTNSPVLAGILRPTILLPASLSQSFNRQVLIHEFAHLQRRDCAWNLLGRLLAAFYYFQPLIWVTIRLLEQMNEHVCDGQVLNYTGQRTRYARHLVELAERLGYGPRPQLASIGMVGLRSSLGRRVRRILDTDHTSFTRTPRYVLTSIHAIGLAIVLFVCLLGLPSASCGKRMQWQSFQSSQHQTLSSESDSPSEFRIQGLVETLTDTDANERARSVKTLGKMNSHTKNIIPHLIKRLEDESWLVKKAAAEVLAQIGIKAHNAVPPLIKTLRDQDWLVRESSAYALAAVCTTAGSVVGPLMEALDDNEWQVRKAAATALSTLGSGATPAVTLLHQALLDHEWQVRYPAAQALAAIGPQSYPAVPNLVQVLNDEEWHVRRAAAQALAAIGTRAKPGVSLLTKLMSDEEWQVRQSAALALGAIGPDAAAAIPALIKQLDDPQWHCRHAATEALEQVAQGNKRAIPKIIDALLDPEWNKRKVAAQSLQDNL